MKQKKRCLFLLKRKAQTEGGVSTVQMIMIILLACVLGFLLSMAVWEWWINVKP